MTSPKSVFVSPGLGTCQMLNTFPFHSAILNGTAISWSSTINQPVLHNPQYSRQEYERDTSFKGLTIWHPEVHICFATRFFFLNHHWAITYIFFVCLRATIFFHVYVTLGLAKPGAGIFFCLIASWTNIVGNNMKRQWAGTTCWVCRGVGIKTQYSTGSSWRPCSLLVMWILAFSVPGFSNLFTGSALNALDLYMKYTVEMVPLHTYIVWFTSVQRQPHVQEV